MGYVEDNLVEGERVVHRTCLHWSIFIGPAALSMLVIGLPWLLAAWIRYRTSEFAVTNRRVIIKQGLMSRRTLELKLAKIESIGVDQGLLGRIFDFGTIVVIGTGGTREAFPQIRAPLAFRRAVDAAADGATAAAG